MFHRAGKQHLLSKKGRRHKKRLSKYATVSKTDQKRISRLLPY